MGKAIRWALPVVAVLVCAALGCRAWRQHENAAALAIHTPNGVQEAMFVPAGGIGQWIEIRGEDRRNPVILFLHGGPGASVTALSSLFRSWEKRFTVVMWDQRCAGKTFARNGADSCKGMSVESVAREGNQVAEFLRRHLHRDRIVLLGHSWGTMIGLRMIHDRPDLYSAYVGTGQVVSIAEKEPVIYHDALARLRAAHDEDGVTALQAIGPPPYKTFQDEAVERDWSERHDIPSERDLRSNMTPLVLFAPGWSIWDTYQTFERAQHYAEAATFDADKSYDARKLGPDFAVPVYVFNGERDTITPTALARRWYDGIRAPRKDFVVLKGGHSSVLTAPDAFLDALVTHLQPGATHG